MCNIFLLLFETFVLLYSGKNMNCKVLHASLTRETRNFRRLTLQKNKLKN